MLAESPQHVSKKRTKNPRDVPLSHHWTIKHHYYRADGMLTIGIGVKIRAPKVLIPLLKAEAHRRRKTIANLCKPFLEHGAPRGLIAKLLNSMVEPGHLVDLEKWCGPKPLIRQNESQFTPRGGVLSELFSESSIETKH